MEGFPQSGGYAYSVIVGFLGSCPYPGWQHHNNTMSVYTAISSLKNHSGEPVVASGYFVDKCVWVWVLMYIWYYVQVYVCCVSMSSLVFNTMYSKSMCYLFCLYPNVKHVCMQVLILLSFSCECPVFDSLCVEFMDVCLILCHCNILSPPVLIVRSIFSSCMYVFVRGWVCLCVCEIKREKVCVVVCLQLEIILFGGLLPELFCIVVWLNQPICIHVECPILKPINHTVSFLPSDDLTVSSALLLSYFVFNHPYVSVYTDILLCFKLFYVHIFSCLYIPHPTPNLSVFLPNFLIFNSALCTHLSLVTS